MQRPIERPVLMMCCIDPRYFDATAAFVRGSFHAATFDVKTDAGGVKAMLDEGPAVRGWIVRSLRLACEQRGIKTVILVNHQDCAAYGGSSAFKDGAEETACHAQQLAMAASLLRATFSRLTVRMFYAHQASRGIVFAEIVGSRPRRRAARRVCTRG